MILDAPSAAGGVAAFALFILAMLHVYWAIPGNTGPSAVIPSVDGKPLFIPSRTATIAVAVALSTAALFVLGTIGVLGAKILPYEIYRAGTWGVSAVFFLRAVGYFRYVGYFKRVRGTGFAVWDTWLYSPLCLVLSAACGAVALFS